MFQNSYGHDRCISYHKVTSPESPTLLAQAGAFFQLVVAIARHTY